MIYKLIIDYGKPFSELIEGEEQLFKRLRELKEEYESNPDGYSYFDVIVLGFDSEGVDITEEVFKRLEQLEKEKEEKYY